MAAEDKKKAWYRSPEISEPDYPTAESEKERTFAAYLILYLILFCIWILLSGKFDLFHLGLGLISCAIVTIFTGDLLIPDLNSKGLFRSWARFIGYVPWLMYQIFLANLHILFLVLHPRMKERINPQIIQFQSQLNKELALITFANSITLTPGTITVYVSVDGEFQIHAIDDKSAEALPGEMERRVAKAFKEL